MSVRSRKAFKFDFDPNRYPRSTPSWDTTNAEYGRFDYRRRDPLVPGVPGYVYQRLQQPQQPGAAAQRAVDEGLGGIDLRRSTYVDEISDLAFRNFARTSQVHESYDGVEKCAANGPYAAPATVVCKNATIGQIVGTMPSSRRQLQYPRRGDEYVRTCCPGLQASMAGL